MTAFLHGPELRAVLLDLLPLVSGPAPEHGVLTAAIGPVAALADDPDDWP